MTGQPSVVANREVLSHGTRSDRIGPTRWVAYPLPAPVLMEVEEGYFVGCSAAIKVEQARGPDHGLTEQLFRQ